MNFARSVASSLAGVSRSFWLASMVLALVGCGGGDGGGSSSAAGLLCHEMVSCGSLPSSYESLCQKSLDMYVPDPEAALACVEAQDVTCSSLQSNSDVDAFARNCLYDTSRFSCRSSAVLNICSPSSTGHPSVCKDLDCSTACGQVFGMSGSCGHDSAAGWDKCLCM